DQPNDARAAKRARFTSPQGEQNHRRGASPLVLVAGLVVVLALVGGVLIALSSRGQPARAAAAPRTQVDSSQFAADLSSSAKPTAGQSGTTSWTDPQGSAQSGTAPAAPVKAATLGHD